MLVSSYGSVVPIHSRDPTKFQHQGFGMLLMEEAERIARDEHGSRKLAVISGNWAWSSALVCGADRADRRLTGRGPRLVAGRRRRWDTALLPQTGL